MKRYIYKVFGNGDGGVDESEGLSESVRGDKFASDSIDYVSDINTFVKYRLINA